MFYREQRVIENYVLDRTEKRRVLQRTENYVLQRTENDVLERTKKLRVSKS